ncbi:hypothetical protein [Pseudofulvibacter geojedonensis]|uniref:Curlin associated repeat-containing protein n=1 Tax=Pseudofulvibacter geojedonensis TaxID=1123758 RepID=A0ABW3I2M9_9FLAO
MKRYIVLILIMFFGALTAQNYTNTSSEREQVKSLYILEQVNRVNTTPNYSFNNNVYLRQIGNENLSSVIIESSKSNINILQKGDKNQVHLNIKATEVNENIVQLGNNNFFRDFNRRNNLKHQVDVYQKGDNQQIMMNGANSLSEKIKIRLIGNDKTIYVNSF